MKTTCMCLTFRETSWQQGRIRRSCCKQEKKNYFFIRYRLTAAASSLNLSQLDITVSTRGEERLGAGKAGTSWAKIYKLDTGEFEQEVQLDAGDTLLKLGIVQFEEFSDLLYMVINDVCANICGVMFDLSRQEQLWRLELHTVFNYNFSVFSLFTHRGLLLFGRQPEDSYPFTWLWQGRTFEGMSVKQKRRHPFSLIF